MENGQALIRLFYPDGIHGSVLFVPTGAALGMLQLHCRLSGQEKKGIKKTVASVFGFPLY